MAKQTTRLVVNDWKGKQSNKSPYTNPLGAQAADNVSLITPGVLQPRRGMRPLTFANAIARTTGDVIAVYGFEHPANTWVLWEDDQGNLRAGRGPT